VAAIDVPGETIAIHDDKDQWQRCAKHWQDAGAGEIMLTAMDREGTLEGYDCKTLQHITSNAMIPVIAHGGAGTYQHMLEAIEAGADAVAAGAMSVSVLGAAPAATLLGGDMLASTDQLLPVAYAGAVASGAGQITVPLQRPVQRALSAGAAVQWQRASGLFQLVSAEVAFSYGSGGWQRPVTLPFREVFA
jgi:hypothetical protein